MPRAPRPDHGFTLVELMSVVTIIGVLAAVAVFYVRPSDYAGTARGYADQLAALADQARLRAMSTQRIQRIEIDGDGVVHLQATTTGLAAPTAWEEVATIFAPASVGIAATSPRTHIQPDDDVPEPGSGLGAAIELKPDGSSQALTIFISDDRGRRRARLAIYGATGTGRVFEGW